jgi:3-isopropylmalate dehydratase small subunit
MGDQDVAHAFAFGKVWFEVPKTVRVILKGRPGRFATPKDIVLALLRHFGANGLLGFAAELYGDYVEKLGLSGRITIASMATEMGAIIAFLPPSIGVISYCEKVCGRKVRPICADRKAVYENEVEIDIAGLEPLISRPGHPEDVVPVSEVEGKAIDSAFIGSCTNGRYEDMFAAARIVGRHKLSPSVLFKVVPSTDKVWRKCLRTGILEVFKKSGVLVGNAGCAGCAEGQIGQNGQGEVTVSTGNRNFAGKQGKGEVFLASPATAAASAAAGYITTVEKIPHSPFVISVPVRFSASAKMTRETNEDRQRPFEVQGRVWLIDKDNVDTDMIYHNRHLAITELNEMGQYTFGNLNGYEDFAKRAKPGDIVVAGKNFGAGSSRQQAVDCFKSLGINAILAESFGAIYQRNAINAGMPVLTSDVVHSDLHDGDEIKVNFCTGEIFVVSSGEVLNARPFSDVQMAIYKRGGLLGN